MQAKSYFTLHDHLENELPSEQAGFKKGRGTRNKTGSPRNTREEGS